MGLQSVESGQMLFEGRDLVRMHAGEWSSMRRAVQIVLPNQGSLFNPRLTVEETILEPLLAHRVVPRREARKEVRRLIDSVHLSADILKCHPHQLSGEQHLRIGIARATALRPKLIICDESLSALDINAQSQILNLLQELQAELKLSYLFISNDLNAVHYIADRVMVMQAGKIIERGTADDVLKHPKEPYTKKLVASVPSF
jgi:peptide/nickel transport system ATP-binding protein